MLCGMHHCDAVGSVPFCGMPCGMVAHPIVIVQLVGMQSVLSEASLTIAYERNGNPCDGGWICWVSPTKLTTYFLEFSARRCKSNKSSNGSAQ